MKTEILLLLLLGNILNFRSKTGYLDYNLEFNDFLNRIKDFLPVSLILNTIEQYQTTNSEISYELESCFLNLRGDLHYQFRDDFVIHQKQCLNNFFNFYSQFIILRDVINSFLIENCPQEYTEECKDLQEEFKQHIFDIEQSNEQFIDMLIETDDSMEQLGKNFNAVKPENIKRVIMNSILILNKENFYAQLNQALSKKTEDLQLAEAEENEEEEEQSEKQESEVKEIKRDDGKNYLYNGGLKDDPFQNPEHYFLKSDNYVPMEDLHIIFGSDDNESDLIKQKIKFILLILKNKFLIRQKFKQLHG